MYTEEDIEKYRLWKLLKTGSLYWVEGVSESSTNGEEGDKVVVYRSLKHHKKQHRKLAEFADGRFEPIPLEEK